MVCSDKSDPDLSHFLSGILILESTSIDYSLIHIYNRYFCAIFCVVYRKLPVNKRHRYSYKKSRKTKFTKYIENYLSYDNISRTLLFGQSPLHFLRLSFADAWWAWPSKNGALCLVYKVLSMILSIISFYQIILVFALVKRASSAPRICECDSYHNDWSCSMLLLSYYCYVISGNG